MQMCLLVLPIVLLINLPSIKKAKKFTLLFVDVFHKNTLFSLSENILFLLSQIFSEKIAESTNAVNFVSQKKLV